MDDFDPTELRDWKDLDTLYKHPKGAPSDARAAGEKILKYCDTHTKEIYPPNCTLCLKPTDSDDNINEKPIDVKPPKIEEINT